MESWPAAEGVVSTLTSEATLHRLCRNFGIPEEYKPACAGVDGRACKTPPHLEGSICVYEGMLESGMRVPLHPFYCEVLRHYGLAPSQFAPNAWRYIAAFTVLCTDIGVRPRLSLFLFFFSERPKAQALLVSLCPPQGMEEEVLLPLLPDRRRPFPVKWGKLRGDYACEPELDREAKNDVEKIFRCRAQKKIPSIVYLVSNDKLAAAMARANAVRVEENAGVEPARATSKRKSPASDQSLPPAVPLLTPPPVGSASGRDQPLCSDNRRGDDADGDATSAKFKRLKDGLVEAMDEVQEENSALRKALVEAKDAAKAEVAEAKESEAAAKAMLAKVREEATVELAKVREEANAELAKAKEAAKAEVVEATEAVTAAIAELAKVTEAAKATVTKVAEEAKVEVAKAKKSEMAAKAELTKIKKSQDAKLQEFKDCCQAKLQMFSTELMKTFNGALDTDTVTPTHSVYPKSE
ncbi:hypothetical protein ACP4OV_002922 [Aristida adscensionis]